MKKSKNATARNLGLSICVGLGGVASVPMIVAASGLASFVHAAESRTEESKKNGETAETAVKKLKEKLNEVGNSGELGSMPSLYIAYHLQGELKKVGGDIKKAAIVKTEYDQFSKAVVAVTEGGIGKIKVVEIDLKKKEDSKNTEANSNEAKGKSVLEKAMDDVGWFAAKDGKSSIGSVSFVKDDGSIVHVKPNSARNDAFIEKVKGKSPEQVVAGLKALGSYVREPGLDSMEQLPAGAQRMFILKNDNTVQSRSLKKADSADALKGVFTEGVTAVLVRSKNGVFSLYRAEAHAAGKTASTPVPPDQDAVRRLKSAFEYLGGGSQLSALTNANYLPESYLKNRAFSDIKMEIKDAESIKPEDYSRVLIAYKKNDEGASGGEYVFVEAGGSDLKGKFEEKKDLVGGFDPEQKAYIGIMSLVTKDGDVVHVKPDNTRNDFAVLGASDKTPESLVATLKDFGAHVSERAKEKIATLPSAAEAMFVIRKDGSVESKLLSKNSSASVLTDAFSEDVAGILVRGSRGAFHLYKPELLATVVDLEARKAGLQLKNDDASSGATSTDGSSTHTDTPVGESVAGSNTQGGDGANAQAKAVPQLKSPADVIAENLTQEGLSKIHERAVVIRLKEDASVPDEVQEVAVLLSHPLREEESLELVRIDLSSGRDIASIFRQASDLAAGSGSLFLGLFGLDSADTSFVQSSEDSAKLYHLDFDLGADQSTSDVASEPKVENYRQAVAKLFKDGGELLGKAGTASKGLESLIQSSKAPLQVARLDIGGQVPENIRDYVVVIEKPDGNTLLQRLQRTEEGGLKLVSPTQARSLLDMSKAGAKGTLGGETVNALLTQADAAGWKVKAIYGLQPDAAAEGGLSVVRYLPEEAFAKVEAALKAGKEVIAAIAEVEADAVKAAGDKVPAVELAKVDADSAADAAAAEPAAVAEEAEQALAMLEAAQVPGLNNPALRRQAYADALAYMGRAASRFDGQLLDELGQDHGLAAGDSRLWAGLIGASESIAGSGDREDSKERSQGVAAGVVFQLRDDLTLGVALGQTVGKVSSDGKAKLDLTQVAVAGLHRLNGQDSGPYLGGGLGAAHAGIQAKRSHEGETARGKTSATQFHASVKLGSDIDAGDWTFEPSLGLMGVQTHLKGTREKNEGLHIKSQVHNSAFAQTGLNLSRNFQLEGWMLKPELSAQYQYRLSSPESVKVAYDDTSWRQPGATDKRGGAGFGLGLEVRKSLMRAKAEVADDGAVNLSLGVSW